MTTTADRLLLWSPRILGVLVSVFLAMFALDAFDEGASFAGSLPAFFIHLIPALMVLGLVIASFRRPLIGGVAFIALAFVYAATMSKGRLDWMLVISGPLLAVGALFLWSWLVFRKTGPLTSTP